MKKIDLIDDYKYISTTENTKRYFCDIKLYKSSKHDEELINFQEIRKGNERAKNEMIESHLKLVVSVAKEYIFDNFELDDLIQEGNLGLCCAIEKFDTSMGFKFSSFAIKYIQGYILSYIYKNRRLLYCPMNGHNKISKLHKLLDSALQKCGESLSHQQLVESYKLKYNDSITEREIALLLEYDQSYSSIGKGDPIDNDAENLVMKQLYTESIQCDINRVFDTLPLRGKEIIEEYFGFNGNVSTIEEIGEKYGLTRMRINQIKEHMIRRMQHKFRRNILKKYM